MSKTAVVTDSTAYIPEEMMQDLPLHSIPLQVIWGGETFRDGIDIQPMELYTRLKHAKVMPSTSQPSPAAFEQVYNSLLEENFDIISIHISDKLSGTIASAIQAKQNIQSERIAIIDSESASMGLGFVALEVARAAQNGASFDDCLQLTKKIVPTSNAIFTVSTLEFLHRGGRIGGASAFLGTALGVKPILALKDGKIIAIEKVRTMTKAIDRLLDIFSERVAGKSHIHLSTLHANAPVDAEKLLNQVCNRVPSNHILEAFVTNVSPAIGTHTGPGTVGLAWIALE